MAPTPDPLVRALCLALARYPRLTLQQLAAQVGISKATLYRLAPTRETLLDLLSTHAMQVGVQTFEDAALETKPVLQALRDVTQALLEKREFYAFAMTHQWVSALDYGENPEHQRQSAYYETRMAALFVRGQREGVLRRDLPTMWLVRSYNFLLYSALDAEQRGELNATQLTDAFLGVFLQGVVRA